MMRKLIVLEKIILLWIICYHASLFGQNSQNIHRAQLPLVCDARDKMRTLKFSIDEENRLMGKIIGRGPLTIALSQDDNKPITMMRSIIRANQILPLNFDCVLETDDEDVGGIRENYFEKIGEKYLAVWKVEGAEIPCTYDFITYDGLLRVESGTNIFGMHTGNGKALSEKYECKHHEYGSRN
ncbi:MAG: hypothetical protein QE271_00960 [Bacteriovoracaceae bacterium]|nr:hypothetical protein [Bacteriovoracaceae bacterium]